MRITAEVAAQLQLLHDHADRGEDFAAQLDRLGRDVAVAVPSCLAVAITVTPLGDEISVSMTAEPAEVLASLAVPLSAVPSGGVLILRAGQAGAFVLLADDLAGRLGPGHRPIDLDLHLAWPTEAPGKSVAASLADLSVLDHAVGVLLDRGLPTDAAHRELRRRAGEAGTSVTAVSRELLASLRPGPGRS